MWGTENYFLYPYGNKFTLVQRKPPISDDLWHNKWFTDIICIEVAKYML